MARKAWKQGQKPVTGSKEAERKKAKEKAQESDSLLSTLRHSLKTQNVLYPCMLF